MGFVEVPKDRALAIMLPIATFIAHTTSFLVLGAMFAASWSTSWCAVYNLVATGASVIGVWGAVTRRPALITFYAIMHTITLVIITVVLVANVLPIWVEYLIPIPSHMRYDAEIEKRMCEELDDGFGWDANWLDQCVSSFKILTTSAFWAGLAMVVAQWWAVISVWAWLFKLKREGLRRRKQEADIERAEHMDEKQMLRDSKEH